MRTRVYRPSVEEKIIERIKELHQVNTLEAWGILKQRLMFIELPE